MRHARVYLIALVAVVGGFIGRTYSAAAAISLDNPTTANCSTNCAGNINWMHTVSGQNRGLLVFIQGADTCTYTVLYNNTAMTSIGDSGEYDTNFRTYAYKMENPATSATGVSISSNPGCGWVATAVSYQGVDQRNMVDTSTFSTNAAGSAATVTTTPTFANGLLISAHGQDSNATWTPGSGQTERVDYAFSSRSITVTDVSSPTAGTPFVMTSQPSMSNAQTGSVGISLKPVAVQMSIQNKRNIAVAAAAVAVLIYLNWSRKRRQKPIAPVIGPTSNSR